MSTKDLTRVVLPYARHALNEARPLVIQAVGRAGWIALWPAWAVVTGPLLPVLVRLAIELAIGLLSPSLLPVLGVIESLSGYLSDASLPGKSRAVLAELAVLLRTSHEDMMPPVRSALASPPAAYESDGGADGDTPGGEEGAAGFDGGIGGEVS